MSVDLRTSIILEGQSIDTFFELNDQDELKTVHWLIAELYRTWSRRERCVCGEQCHTLPEEARRANLTGTVDDTDKASCRSFTLRQSQRRHAEGDSICNNDDGSLIFSVTDSPFRENAYRRWCYPNVILSAGANQDCAFIAHRQVLLSHTHNLSLRISSAKSDQATKSDNSSDTGSDQQTTPRP